MNYSLFFAITRPAHLLPRQPIMASFRRNDPAAMKRCTFHSHNVVSEEGHNRVSQVNKWATSEHLQNKLIP